MVDTRPFSCIGRGLGTRLPHTCVITIKWAWLRLQAMHNHSFGAETWQKTSLAWFQGSVAARSYLDYFKYSPQKLVFCATVVVDDITRYWSELIKAALD